MSVTLRWRDAARAAEGLASQDWRLLDLLLGLPLAPPETLRPFAGGCERALRGRLADLRARGLVAGTRVPLEPGHNAERLYLGDLGLGALALARGDHPSALARRHRVRRADLRALAEDLTNLAAAHRLLAALAAWFRAPVALVAWRCPWRGVVSARGRRRTASAPACAALAVGERRGEWLLVPDRATAPLVGQERMVRDLLAYRRAGGAVPPLMIATVHAGRAAAWRRLLERAAREARLPPLEHRIVLWDELAAPPIRCPATAAPLVEPLALDPELASRRLPRPVGDGLAPTRPPVPPDRCDLALALTHADRRALDHVGGHAFLTTACLAGGLESRLDAARQRRDRLLRLGFLRLEERRIEGVLQTLLELTEPGMDLVARDWGLPRAVAERVGGLIGGGPRDKRQAGDERTARDALLDHPAHTLAIERFFVDLRAAAHSLAGAGYELVEWRNAVQVAWQGFRPDAYGIVRRGDEYFAFFLELDRATEKAAQYRAKFRAYEAYAATAHAERTYGGGFPTVLVVTTKAKQEALIASVLAELAQGRRAPLRVLVTENGQLRTSLGAFGPVFVQAGVAERQTWLPDPEDPRHAWAARRCLEGAPRKTVARPARPERSWARATRPSEECESA